LYVIPAVDIMGGKVVRLLRGDPKLARIYEHLGSPLALAKKWEAEGAPAIHVVDLDAALGRGENGAIIDRIIESISIPVQVGGGIRSVEKARQLINAGAARIVLGSLAFKNPGAIKALLSEFGCEKIVVALDHLNGEVKIGGWRRTTHMMLDEAAEMFSEMGVKFLLVTSIHRDGAMSGPDIGNLSKILGLGVNVMSSGGIRSLEDIKVLRDLRVYGVIVGRALYEGRFSLREALSVTSRKNEGEGRRRPRGWF